jgi:PhzF family phenazine biosynthesis protein
VVLDAAGLSDTDMQEIARWTNLSETTFVLPATDNKADYRLRIFTPRSELPFAGHPALGSAHAVLEARLVRPTDGNLVQECGVGLVKLRVSGEGANQVISLGMPPAKLTPLNDDQLHELEAILGMTVDRAAQPAVVDVGAIWVVAQLADADDVLRLKPDFARLAVFERQLGVTGLTVFGKHAQGVKAIEVRSFAPSCGVEEDPVCGSGNGGVAYFQLHHSLVATSSRYIAGQGQCVGRDGTISIEVKDGVVNVGGSCVTCVEGTLLTR